MGPLARRDFLATMCRGGLATFALPLARFARVPVDGALAGRKLVFVLLRGGVDGLAAVVPTGDPGYAAARGALALGAAGLAPLADGFTLAPGLAPLAEVWRAGELLPLHAMAIPFRTRSHFDGQAVLETGLGRPDQGSDGWINRLLQEMGGRETALGIGAGMPRSLMGPRQVTTWSPAQLGAVGDAYLDRLHLLYRADPVLANPFEAALQLAETAGEGTPAAAARTGRATATFAAAARLLRAPDAPNLAALEFSGWDTHRAQGGADGALDRLLGQLAEGLLAFRSGMGSDWPGTTVVVMTEFGRTARPNGSGGTDHGTAGAGFLLGTEVAGGRVVADWPGLAAGQLYEGRDLRPTLDTRAVLKGVLAGTFDLPTARAERVFPDSSGARARTDLMR